MATRKMTKGEFRALAKRFERSWRVFERQHRCDGAWSYQFRRLFSVWGVFGYPKPLSPWLAETLVLDNLPPASDYERRYYFVPN